jgi:RNA polymerase sigma-70 factor (ECF subfamily)
MGQRVDLGHDRKLMNAVESGDRYALADLYDRHAPAMLGVAARILRDKRDAEDLVHDVFVEAWRKAASFSAERGSVRAWLLVRTRSRAIDRLRNLDVARRHVRNEQAVPVDAAPALADDPSATPDQARARAALAELPETQRVVLELAYYEGLTCSEIATRCGTPLGTVKSRLSAGMRELRRRFAAGEGGAG